MKVGVSLVSYNTKAFLRKTLEKFNRRSSDEYEVWVLDNNSEDGSSEMVMTEFPKVNLTKSEKNLGFAKGQNIILKKIHAEIILILNPDTEFELKDLDEMIIFMKKNKNLGILSCKILDYSNNLQSNGGDLPFGEALINWLFNLEILGFKKNFHRIDKDYYKSPKKVGWVGGTFMLVKKEVLEKVDYFNEDYFMYFEDVELCFKTRKLGYEVMIYPEVNIRHYSGASSKDPRFNQWVGEFRGLIKFYKKYYGLFGESLVISMIYISSFSRVIAFYLFGKPRIAKTYVKVIKSI